MRVFVYLDTILVPFSVFLTVGYHVYLWQSIKSKPSTTTVGINKLRRKAWFQNYNQGGDKKDMMAVQSLRNTLMTTILSASIAILVCLAVAALTNNAYNATHLFSSAFFGSPSGKLFVLKYGAASLFLLVSFLCSSMAVGFLIDANILMNSYGEFSSLGMGMGMGMGMAYYTQTIFERGYTLAFLGNRVFYITCPLLLWMFGPVAVMLSSVGLVWGLYELDFAGKPRKIGEPISL